MELLNANGVVKHMKEKLECLVIVVVIVHQNVKKKLVSNFLALSFQLKAFMSIGNKNITVKEIYYELWKIIRGC